MLAMAGKHVAALRFLACAASHTEPGWVESTFWREQTRAFVERPSLLWGTRQRTPPGPRATRWK